ncbi:Uncharacterized protein APZ42_031276 [Daphnia magna]|uniref:DUF4806 domain-containing protein n=1 Tax=Daphnia magna TaxID=35525 RepID=A0A164MZH0_9CRUS|nr:Uncharacterized protein APZ42_031276 [Daphnia magna]
MDDEEASDVEQQTNFAENDRDRMSASNLSSTPKTYIHKKKSRLEFRHHEEQSEAAPQHESQEGNDGEKFQIEVNQDSIFKLFKLLPIMQSTLNEVLRCQENTMRHLKLLDQKMEGITRKLAGVNNAGPSESEHVARLLSKLPLNSVDEMTEFLGEIKDAIADKSITIEYLRSAFKLEGGSTAEKLTINILKSVVSLELARKFTYFGKSVRESFPKSELDEKFFQKHISNWLNGIYNEQDYGESDDSGENEDDSGDNEDGELSEMESSFEEDGEFTDEEESLENRVAAIAIKHRLSAAADRRTILKTPRTKLCSTSFKHFGLIKGLDRKLKSGLLGSAGAELQISIDGLPLCKSRPTVFCPILCGVKNANDSINEETVLLQSLAFICDATARAFFRGTVGHTSFHGCERCDVVGTTKMRRRVFKSFNARLRTDASFRGQRDQRHHKGRTPLLNLGTFKRFLTIILKDGYCKNDKNHKLTDEQILRVNYLIESLSKYLSSEFNRKGRSSEELGRWNATEFRTFLVYTGLGILKEVLSEEKYHHFLYFFVAMRLLLSPSPTSNQISFANQCLRKYVHQFDVIYGDQHLVFNLHNLIHLTDDCDFYQASLNDINAFPFENYLGQMKNDIQGTVKPLAQFCRRQAEKDNNETFRGSLKVKSITESLKNDSIADSVIMLANKKILKIKSFKSGGGLAVAHAFNILYDLDGSKKIFFNVPMPATDVDLYICGDLKPQRQLIPIDLVEKSIKCIKLPFNDGMVERPK